MRKHITLSQALSALEDVDERFVKVMSHGTMEVEVYVPEGKDLQTPHTRDELYIVMQGTGIFLNGMDRHAFGPGDVLFVPAGVEHRFESFTDDFKTWVIFYGPEAGENSNDV